MINITYITYNGTNNMGSKSTTNLFDIVISLENSNTSFWDTSNPTEFEESVLDWLPRNIYTNL